MWIENLELINLIALSINAISYGWFAKEFWNISVNRRLINFEWIKILIVVFTLSSILSSINFKIQKMIIIIPIFQLILLMITLFTILGIAWYKEKNEKDSIGLYWQGKTYRLNDRRVPVKRKELYEILNSILTKGLNNYNKGEKYEKKNN